MRLMRHILFLIISVVCVMHNAMADCKVGQTNMKEGQHLTHPVKQSMCKVLHANISDANAYDFTIYCVKSGLKCVAHTCPNNQKPDKNGICSGANPQEQARFHKNLLTHTYQKRNFFDACPSFDTNTIQNKVVKETQSVITDLNRKAKYACITDFATYNLSTALAIGLIERYNWSNGIGQIRADNCTTRQNNRFVSGGGRSIRCVADNGIFVEFLFGKMDSLSTTRESVAGAFCPMFGFDTLNSRTNPHRCHIKDKNKTTKNLAEFLRKTELMDVKHIDNGYFEIVPLRADIAKDKRDELSSYIYTDEFKNIVTIADPHIQILLRKYINQRLKAAGYDVKTIKFYSARSDAYYTADNSTWPVEIFVCKKNDCKTYIKAFKFRSLSGLPDLHFATWTTLSVEQMSCLIMDGLFDSKHCFFLEEDINNEKKQCSATNTLIKSVLSNNNAKAEFDTDDNMCVLHASKKNANTLKGLGIAAQVGMLALTTIATAGAGSALAIGLAAGGLLADGVVLAMDVKMNKASLKFLKLSTRCYNATCAKKYFEEEFAHMLRLMDRINEDEFRVIDSEMDRLVQLLDDKYLSDKYATKLDELKDETSGFFANMSTEEAIETVATVVSLVLSLGSAAEKGVKLLVTKTKKLEPKFIKRLGQRLDKIRKAKKTKNATNTGRAAQRAGNADDAADLRRAVPVKKTVIPKFAKDINVNIITNAEVKEVYMAAYNAEPKITEDLVGIVDNMPGDLHGLEYRMKTPESFLEKIGRDRVDLLEKAQKAGQTLNITDADIAREFKDIVRYTYASSADGLVQNTRQLISNMNKQGYKVIQIKNTFTDPTNPIDMINMRVVSPNQQVFELQANTPHNLYVKDNLMHADYEAWRIIKDKDSPAAQELSKRMFKTAEQFEIPKGIENFK